MKSGFLLTLAAVGALVLVIKAQPITNNLGPALLSDLSRVTITNELQMTQMTLLETDLTNQVVTNWTATTTEYPAYPATGSTGGRTLEYRPVGYHESGIIISNIIGVVHWKEKKIPVVLESVEIGRTNRVDWR